MSVTLTRHGERRAAVLTLSESATRREEDRRQLLERVTEARRLVVDVSAVAALDFEDVALLVSARKAHAGHFGTHMNLFKVVAQPTQLPRLLRAMQMEHLLPTYASREEALAAFPQRRLLLIEPDEASAAMLELLLEANGFEVVRRRRSSTGGSEADDGGFEIVLTEIEFDDKVDPDLVRRLRIQHRAPVGVLTRTRPATVDLAAFIAVKPVDPARLMAEVEGALRSPIHEYYAGLIDLVPAPLAVFAASGRQVLVNRAWRAHMANQGASGEDDGEHSGFPAGVLASLQQSARTGTPAQVSLRTTAGAIELDLVPCGIAPDGREPHVLVTPRATGQGVEATAPREVAMRDVLLSLLEDLDRTRNELTAANARLVEVDRLKSELVSGVSHDLRSPISAIRGSVENLLDGFHGHVESRQRRTLEVVLRNAKRVTLLTDRLLELWRRDPAESASLPRAIDLREPLRRAVAAALPAHEKLGVHLELRMAETPVQVRADPQRLQQVVSALLEGSLRTARSEVQVSLTAGEDEARVAVEDDGPPPTDAELERRFEAAGAVEPTAADGDSTGLRLPLARGLSEIQGARIGAESSGTGGGGSRVVIRLPILADRPASGVDSTATGQVRSSAG